MRSVRLPEQREQKVLASRPCLPGANGESLGASLDAVEPRVRRHATAVAERSLAVVHERRGPCLRYPARVERLTGGRSWRLLRQCEQQVLGANPRMSASVRLI